MQRGRLIAFEGIDGSGKRTQMDLLCEALESRGILYVRVSFPRYTSFFGTLVGRFLNGEFGQLEQVNAHLSALLYAGDRFEAKKDLQSAIERGKIVLADRYIGSNLAHQAARVPAERRELFLAWLKRLEYNIYGLPEEDVVVYFRLPATEAQRLVGMKAEREYTEKKMDIQEADLRHLQAAADVYEQLAKEPNWATVECFDLEKNELRKPEVIHKEVWAILETRRLAR